MKRKKILLIVALFVAGATVLMTCLFFGFYLSTTKTVMKKTSPDRQHRAKLVRSDGFDVIFVVYVDGKRVYSSPDFAPVPTDFREQIIWDVSGKIAVLQIAGKSIFGYHAVERRALTANELFEVEFTPFEKLGFEETLTNDRQKDK